MELFENTRLKIGNSIFSKNILKAKRKVSYGGIHLIKKIGIVWDASKTGEFASLSKFHQKMQERNIDVKILGYYPGKELPDQLTAIRFLSCIKRKELNLFYIPVSTEADVFLRTKFDILIDINFDKVFPLQYITKLSTSSFKVGLFNSETDSSTFDLMMEIKKPVQVENYLTQVIHYLEKINSGSTVTVVNQ
ncbi:MAG: hypothetical protein MUF36_01475 [Bacteroidales bacterium]|jgi:hypothetical protein|nr:hypothetical protein [Bacteroidales bacterium]